MSNQKPQEKYRLDYQKPNYKITHIDLDVALDDTKTRVIAVSRVEKITTKNKPLYLNGEALDLISVRVNNDDWTDYEQDATSLTLFNLPEVCTLEITTIIDPLHNTHLEGLYKSGNAFCTQCEAEGFRRITYFLDRPDNLAKFTTKITADKKAYPYMLSNGNKCASGNLEGDQHWVKWEDPFPKPSYLFALVAGDFDCLKDTFVTKSKRTIDLEIFVDKGNRDQARHAMLSLQNAMRWDEKRFNFEYDLDIYMVVAVDFFNMGAMENKGLNVFNSKYVLADTQTATDSDYLGIESVIGHEYFHNWTGDRITCRDWFQLSLKEGLTVFRDQEFSSDLGSRSVNRINNVRVIRGPQFAEDASPMSHPIRPEKVIQMNNFYTLTVYEKGSEVIRMIHTLLGEENFQKGMQLYVQRHDGTAATCDDFVAAMQDASGVDLSLFKRWYSQSGTPEVTITSDYNATEHKFTLNMTQYTPSTSDQKEKQALHIPVDIALYTKQGKAIQLQSNGKKMDSVLNLVKEKQSFSFDVAECPVVSLFQEFSAPVKFTYDYSDVDLQLLMRCAQNDFARWDAGQMLLAKYIKKMVVDVQEDRSLVLDASLIDSFKEILTHQKLDKAFIAECLTLPAENEIAGWFDVVDVDAIAQVRHFMMSQFAQDLQDDFLRVYQDLQTGAYELTHAEIAKRTLKNRALAFLAYTSDGEALVHKQYQQADNMTDIMGAMQAANSASLVCRETLLSDFSDKWQANGLVMDKYFMLQGSNPADEVLDIIEKNLRHPSFSLKNPNRTRSLIGTFVNNNPKNFHAQNGRGYQFLLTILKELNTSNPQVAARLIDPLLKYRRYDRKRQEAMKACLKSLEAMPNLAKDLYEKVKKALEV